MSANIEQRSAAKISHRETPAFEKLLVNRLVGPRSRLNRSAAARFKNYADDTKLLTSLVSVDDQKRASRWVIYSSSRSGCPSGTRAWRCWPESRGRRSTHLARVRTRVKRSIFDPLRLYRGNLRNTRTRHGLVLEACVTRRAKTTATSHRITETSCLHPLIPGGC